MRMRNDGDDDGNDDVCNTNTTLLTAFKYEYLFIDSTDLADVCLGVVFTYFSFA